MIERQGCHLADRRAYQRKRRRKRDSHKKWIVPLCIAVVVVFAAAGCFAVWKGFGVKATPEETVENYFALVNEGKYDQMYGMLSEESKKKISKEDFVTRNQNIYEGIEAADVKVKLKVSMTYFHHFFFPSKAWSKEKCGSGVSCRGEL